MGLIKRVIKGVFRRETVLYSPISLIAESKVLEGRNIVITGGSSGIGRAIAEACVSRGAEVVILGRNADALREAAAQIGPACRYQVLDLSSEIPEDFFDRVSDKPVTDLVNNAGIYVDYHSLNYSGEEFDSIFKTNCKAPFLLSQFFVKYLLRENRKGSIVFTSSNRSLMGDDGPYGMSKAAINNFIEGLARENISHGIRVNGVAPGMTASNINHIDVNGNLRNAGVRGGRVIHPREIAEVACFLLSDCSKCITGAVIPCDDGDRLR